jgi:hypothetical protein
VKLVKRLLRWFRGLLGGGGDAHGDPFADKLAPLRPAPKSRRGAVAVAEPEDD